MNEEQKRRGSGCLFDEDHAEGYSFEIGELALMYPCCDSCDHDPRCFGPVTIVEWSYSTSACYVVQLHDGSDYEYAVDHLHLSKPAEGASEEDVREVLADIAGKGELVRLP